MMNKFEQSRRQFLRTASLASMAGISASPFLLGLNSLAAMAQGSGSSGLSSALVCVFLQGGNDGHGSVIATDPDSFSRVYAGAVGSAGAGVSAGRAAADHAEDSAERAHLCAESSAWRECRTCSTQGGRRLWPTRAR